MEAVKDWISEWTGKPLSYFSMIERAENLDLDIQLIFDTHDIVVPYGEPVKILNEIQVADVMSTSNKGHGLHQREVTDRILSFVTAA